MSQKLIRQIAFSIFVVGVAGFAYYDYSKNQKQSLQEEKDSKFLQDINFEDVTRIEIKNNKQHIVLVKNNNFWIIEKPIKDRASFELVSAWFDEIQIQKVKSLEMDSGTSWKDYYLDLAPEARIMLEDGRDISFQVSSSSSFDDKFFIKKNNKLFLGEQYFGKEVNDKSVEDFRSKNMISSFIGRPNELNIQNRGVLKLFWKDFRWRVADKNLPFDSTKLEEYWRTLHSTKALNLKERVNAKNLSKYGLNKSQKKIILKYDQKPTITLIFSKKINDRVFVHSSYRDYILEFSPESVDKFFITKKDIQKSDIQKKEIKKSDPHDEH